jgi:hypothetical protein
MSTTHTPGPWEAIGNKICTVGTDRERETIATSNEKAFSDAPNARLIAAAPDLLDALQAIVDYRKKEYLDLTVEPYSFAVKALAKAKGV